MFLRNKIMMKTSSKSLHFGFRGVCAIPHPQKAYRGGEDAFFSHSKGVGVADGVGGYASHGIDPALYTRNVMRYTLEIIEKNESAAGISSLAALTRGWTKARQAAQPGGCPVSLVTIVDNSVGSILNLGDCGLLIFRDNKILFRTETQQHSFNCPYQLPDDSPNIGQQVDLQLNENDIILCASDGLFDNVDDDNLIENVTEVGAKSCTDVAEQIGAYASLKAHDTKYNSPFAKHAKSAGYDFRGGKIDDITIVIAKVTSLNEGEDNCPFLIEELLLACQKN